MATAVYDIESFISDLQTYLIANLNTKITAINTEKGDSVLTTVGSSAYIIQNVSEEIINYDPAIIITLDNIKSTAARGIVNKNYEIIVSLIWENTYNDASDWKRTMRYHRALEDTLCSAFNKVSTRVNFTLESLTPISLELSQSPALHRAVGVVLQVQILN